MSEPEQGGELWDLGGPGGLNYYPLVKCPVPSSVLGVGEEAVEAHTLVLGEFLATGTASLGKTE